MTCLPKSILIDGQSWILVRLIFRFCKRKTEEYRFCWTCFVMSSSGICYTRGISHNGRWNNAGLVPVIPLRCSCIIIPSFPNKIPTKQTGSRIFIYYTYLEIPKTLGVDSESDTNLFIQDWSEDDILLYFSVISRFSTLDIKKSLVPNSNSEICVNGWERDAMQR